MNNKNKYFIIDLIIFILFLVIGGFISIYFGVDTDWDTRNYHLYNPYAFLNNRIGFDIMPASIMTYYNPLLDTIYYLLVKNFSTHAYIITFIFGLSYGLLCFISYKIANIIFKTHKYCRILSFICTVIGCSALFTVITIGRQSHDIFVSFLILSSILLILKSIEKGNDNKLIILSGIILGCTCGLKFSGFPFAFAALLSILINKNSFKTPYKTALIFLICGIIGFWATNGFWMYKLYITFGNPFMPHFNNIFPNEWINDLIKVQDVDIYTAHREVKNINVLQLPFIIHHDYRFALIYIIFIINLIIWDRLENKIAIDKYGFNIKYANFLLVFSTFSILFLGKLFVELRYCTPTAALTGILIIVYFTKFYDFFVNALKIKFSKKTLIIILTCVSIFVMTCVETKYITKMKRKTIKKYTYFVENMNIPNDSIVIVSPGTGFLIPFQNPNARYIYFPEKRFLKRNIQILSDKGYEKIREIIKEQEKEYIYMITYLNLDENEDTPQKEKNEIKRIKNELAKNYKITQDIQKKCFKKTSNINRKKYYICRFKIK